MHSPNTNTSCSRKTHDILGYAVECRSLKGVLRSVSEVIRADVGSASWLACLNPHSYVIAKKDPVFRKALQSAEWLVPDGIGVVIAGRLLRKPVAERITGFDVFEGVMTELNRVGGRVFFLGSTEQTLSRIQKKLAEDYPQVHLAGIYSPPFSDKFSEREQEEMIAAISSAKSDVLWVGMTAPKQEKWLVENVAHLGVPFAGAIGAVFDFYAGNVKRSHPVFRDNGLEWLPRLVQQPRRLWRRVLVSAPIFLWDVFRARING